MNRILKALLVSALALSAAQVKAHTNKTFLMPRSHGVNLPMEYTTFAELVGREDDNKFGGNVQATVFYQASTDGEDTAKYFLFNNLNKITLTRSATAPANNNTSLAKDLDMNYIIHDTAGTTANDATLSLDPEQTAWGVRFDYHQDLDKILKGLYLRVNLPIVHVENDPKLRINATGNFPANIAKTGATAPVQDTLYSIFSGNFEIQGANANDNSQKKLTNAKIAGEQSETGVADIDIALGYKFLNKEKYHAAIALAITIPTGNEADGVHMFEPIAGNGGHFGLGGDLCASGRVWGDMDHNVKLHLKMKYRYLFEDSQRRTLGIKGRNWGQYLLLAPTTFPANSQLVHAANITTLRVDVTPGSQFDGILGLAYNNGGFCLDLGYNLYFREREDVDLKGFDDDGKYAIVGLNKDLNTAGAGGGGALTAANVDGNDLNKATITKDLLDTAAAETPSQTTHGIYSALGYTFKEWDYPLMLAMGGKYEWASKNSALEQWGLWWKLGVGF